MLSMLNSFQKISLKREEKSKSVGFEDVCHERIPN